MRSMTGFGKAAGASVGHRIAAEARSVNHRNLDLVVRLREPFRECEARLRALVTQRVGRGRVELAVEIEAQDGSDTAVRLPRTTLLELAKEVAALHASHPELGLAAPTWGDLLRVPGMVAVEPRGTRWDADDQRVLEAVAVGAVDAMVEAREREGEALARVLTGLLQELRVEVERVARELPAVRERLAERARGRLAELLHGMNGIPPAAADSDSRAWLSEALAHAERSDVTEEIDRLRAHLDHFAATCTSAGPAGRRLDFLAQELLRELQTLSAKCRALEVSDRVLEAKLITERLREQVQNVE
jgi:uncharacterized protein (TIGR00255 family)